MSGLADHNLRMPLQCSYCGLPFRRREHLSRHMNRHSGRRPFQCPKCAKPFSRRDTMKRHLNSQHGASALEEYLAASNKSHRRACRPCARSKQRCDGQGQPCDSCQSKGRDCTYEYESDPIISPSQQQCAEELDTAIRSDAESIGLLSDESLVESAAGNADCTIPISNVLQTGLSDVLHDHTGLLVSPASMLGAAENQFQVSHALEEPPVSNNFPFSPTSFGPGIDWMFNSIPWDTQDTILGDYEQSAGINILEENEQDILRAEHVQHVSSVPAETHARIIQFAREHLPPSDQSINDLPPLNYLDVYLQLYFEHFYKRMPFLHVPTFGVPLSDLTRVPSLANFTRMVVSPYCKVLLSHFPHGYSSHSRRDLPPLAY